jgi:hypothetical protein
MAQQPRRQAQHDQNVLDKLAHITEATTLNSRQQVVRCDSTDGAFAVTLAPVSEMEGRTVSIKLEVDNGDVTIQDADDSLYWDGDYTLNDVGDGYLLYSDGESWYPIGALA